ncbi:hypothetical protein BDP27DRAFT_977768 [Rhodocollybia butyracea]|uniref:Uncharacterized protein n=1 Tax=Rhodocollybia butyracea TaxID=206335 RepID=A0A9P5U5K7_9AGAR|nr:hypothetical protein BDP27DRAFT_977768 [Rhodocollybia butyracea]
MEDNGHFIRTRERKITPAIDEDSPQNDNNAIDLSEGKWCRVCGLGLWAHGAPGLEYMKTEAQLITAAAQARSAEKDKPVLPRIRLKLMSGKVVGRSGPSLPPPPRPPPFQCQIVVKMLQLLKMPVVDIHRIFVPRIQNEPTPSTSLLNPHQLPPWSSRAPRLVKDDPTIVSAVDPHFTLGVWSLVNSLQLPYFAPPSPLVPFPLDTTGVDATDVNANLAPHALLALATRQFIRVLIREAQEVEKRDKELGVGFLFESHNRDVSLLASAPPTRKYNKTGAASVAGRKGKEKEKLKIESIKVLTPMHIITGVVSNYVRATALSSMSSEGRFGSNEGSVGIAIFGCLSRIGIGIEEKQLEK